MSNAQTNLIYDLPSIVERIGSGATFSQTAAAGSGTRLRRRFVSGRICAAKSRTKFHRRRALAGPDPKTRPQRPAGRADESARRAHRVAYFLQYLLPPHSASALHIYFPDPWPKKKHRRHRLINEQFSRARPRRAAPGGTVYLRTDDADYFPQMNEVFGAEQRISENRNAWRLAEMLDGFRAGF